MWMPPKKKTAPIKVIVNVKDGYKASEVAKGLVQAGMTVTQILPTSGVISGTANSLDALKKVPGVHAAEKSLDCHTCCG